MMIEVHPERYIDEPGLYIILNRRDMQSKFRYTTLGAIERKKYDTKLNCINIKIREQIS